MFNGSIELEPPEEDLIDFSEPGNERVAHEDIEKGTVECWPRGSGYGLLDGQGRWW